MSMNKAIEHGKEHRRPYHGAKAVDSMCRNHGGCNWCRRNRMYSRYKKMKISEEKIREYLIWEDASK